MKMRSEYGKAQNHHIGLNENKNRVYQLKNMAFSRSCENENVSDVTYFIGYILTARSMPGQ